MKKNYWKSAVAGTIGAALLVTAGCSDTSDLGSQTAGDGKEAVLTVWGLSDFLKGEESPGQQMVNEFNEKYKGQIRVEARYMPAAEYNTAIQAAIASNDLPDIYQTPSSSDIRTFVANGHVLPFDGLVSDSWKSRFFEGSFVEGVNVIDGKTYSWPLTGPQLGSILYYNKDVLKQTGLDPEKPPKTWDELIEMARTVTAKGKGDVFGVVFGGGESGGNSGVVNFVNALAAGASPEAAGGFNYKTGKYAYDSKATLDSFNLLLKLKQDGSILPSSFTLKGAEAGIMFGQGKAAFLIDGRARMWIVKRDTPDAKFGLAQVPTPDGSKPTYYYVPVNPSGYMISSKTKHPKEVGIFLENGFTAPIFYERYLKSGVALTPIESINNNKSLYPYPEFNTFMQLHKDLLRVRPDYAVKNAQTAKVVVELGTLDQPKVKPGFNDILQSVLSGTQKDAAGLLKAYNDKLNKGLEEAVNKVKASGGNVSPDDFKFPNWDPKKDYTGDDYKALK
ncbi:extracellular solute-binding protein [Paenibacillus sp. H1-7]|uniref:ABC transporter substrate-binding protein n=1 Tax=Paenibacillus sp. H1-7 TaxID=2282849 RepID=UPI001EF75A00|nr:extracellular solute-binding protein [Paenibacillus sp. H1-7]ULL16574.1 extracellular solute-binding protein [Paenibacillus sp. H1-7]